MYRNNQQGRDLSRKRQPSDANHQFEPRINTEVVVHTNVVARIGIKIITAYQVQHIA